MGRITLFAFTSFLAAAVVSGQTLPDGEPSDEEKQRLTRTINPPIEAVLNTETVTAWENITLPAGTKVKVGWIGWDRKWFKASVVGQDDTKQHMISAGALRGAFDADGNLTLFEPPEPALDIKPGPALEKLLTNPQLWETKNLPPGSNLASSSKDREIREYTGVNDFFGHTAPSIQIHIEKGNIQKFEILWLEAGLFFDKSQAEAMEKQIADAESAKASGSGIRRMKRELEKIKETELASNREKFKAAFTALQSSLPKALEASFGSAGQKVRVGTGEMAITPLEHKNTLVTARTLFDPTQMVATTIARNEDVTRRMVGATVGRRSEARENVVNLPNGDVYLENVPSSNQGPRGYCMFGTLAMVLQYYGANTTMEQLQSRFPAEFMEGDKGIHGDLYALSAKECKLRFTSLPTLSFQDIQRAIDSGHPIIVWRVFSYDRQALHNEWRDALAKDPNFQIPNPRQLKEQENWASASQTPGYHSSVITGYNRQRGEVLFSESWGNQARNARMSKEEMAATGYRYTIMKP